MVYICHYLFTEKHANYSIFGYTERRIVTSNKLQKLLNLFGL